jgi:hypothetical protein
MFNQFYTTVSTSLPTLAAMLLSSLENVYSDRFNFLTKLKVLGPSQEQISAFVSIAEECHLSPDFVNGLRNL